MTRTGSFAFNARIPRSRAPQGACDCHVHAFGSADRFPLSEPRRYTPMDAPPEDLAHMLGVLGLSRAVLVQPSVYGADNRCLLEAMTTLGERARGVAVVDQGPQPQELQRLHRAGIRGARLNLAVAARQSPRDVLKTIRGLAAAIAPLGWHLQFHLEAGLLDAVESVLGELPVDIVLDHMGRIPIDAGDGPPGLDSVLRMLGTGRCWVKLSAPYRLNGAGDPFHEGAAILVRALLAANPERLLWGSDWPHTPPHPPKTPSVNRPIPFRRIDTGRMLDLLAEWVPAESLREAILVDNPVRLYGFA
jgi:predicted TIM-barrel fold metal-dependent hydrolase